MSWWLVAFSVRMKPAGRPWDRSWRSKASKGLVESTPPKSNRTASIRRVTAGSDEAVAGHTVPQLGRQTERGHIHPLVHPVEHGGVVLEGQIAG